MFWIKKKRNKLRKKKKKNPGPDVSERLSSDHLAAWASVKSSRERSLYSSNTNLFHHFGGGCRGAKLAGITYRSGENEDRKKKPLLFVS